LATTSIIKSLTELNEVYFGAHADDWEIQGLKELALLKLAEFEDHFKEHKGSIRGKDLAAKAETGLMKIAALARTVSER
jgi:hypothetical protein